MLVQTNGNFVFEEILNSLSHGLAFLASVVGANLLISQVTERMMTERMMTERMETERMVTERMMTERMMTERMVTERMMTERW